jgi:hypothetical protein
MRRFVKLVLVLVLLGPVSLYAGEVIDRIAVTVNNAPILQSDLEVAVRCEALLNGRALETIASADEQATLQRLIDQELLRQQMGNELAPPKPEEVAERLREVRGQIPGATNNNGWRGLLVRYQVSEAELAERIIAQMQIARFLEQRLRPSIRLEQGSVQAYYNDVLLPQLRKSGVRNDPPLREVRPQIQEILVQQRMDQDLASWLRTLRQQSRVHAAPGTVLPPAPVDSASSSSEAGK